MIVVTGPTASGKTRRAVALARALGGEIVSADSRQVYRSMSIGTGKDLDEYGDTPYHLIDIAPAGYRYNLFEWLRDARNAIVGIEGRGHVPIVCGGTGMYIEALLNNLTLPPVPENAALRNTLKDKTLAELTDILASMKRLHNTTDVDTAQRAIRAIEIETYYAEHPELAADTRPHPAYDVPILLVDIPRDIRRRRISQRLAARLDEGMVDEVRALLASGLTPDLLTYYGLEYKFVTRYVVGELTYEDMAIGLETAIHQFAKRQMTWFRGMERRGFTLRRVPWDAPDEAFLAALSQ